MTRITTPNNSETHNKGPGNGPETAIVIGASMGGLAAARVLSDHADHVIVIERDDIPAGPAYRNGVPQGRHAHAILAAGEELLETWYPGIVGQLQAAGAVRHSGGSAHWYQAGAVKVKADVGAVATFASRPLLEHTVRQNLLSRPNVELRDNTKVDDLVVENGRVVGVRVAGELLRASLVVDCTGRNTRFLETLKTAGFPVPKTSNVTIDMSYTTRILRRRDGGAPGTYVIVAPTPPRECRFGVLLPMEDDRWILTMGGFHGDRCPTDDAGFRAFARSLPEPSIANLLETAEVLSDTDTFRMHSNQWRHVERLRRTPAGFLMLGDAICSFNPIYGQGMSSAAKQADELSNVLRSTPLSSPKLARQFYRRARKVVMNPWQIAAGSDFLHPSTTGPKPPGTDLINRYIAKVQQATHVSPEVLSALIDVQNLLAAPPSLMAPPVMWKVFRAARKSPVQTSPVYTTPVYTTPVYTTPVYTTPGCVTPGYTTPGA